MSDRECSSDDDYDSDDEYDNDDFKCANPKCRIQEMQALPEFGHKICYDCYRECRKCNIHHCALCVTILRCKKCYAHVCAGPREEKKEGGGEECEEEEEVPFYCEECTKSGHVCANRDCVNDDEEYTCENFPGCGHLLCDQCSEEMCDHCNKVHCPICVPVFECAECYERFCVASGRLPKEFNASHFYCIACDIITDERYKQEEEKKKKKKEEEDLAKKKNEEEWVNKKRERDEERKLLIAAKKETIQHDKEIDSAVREELKKREVGAKKQKK